METNNGKTAGKTATKRCTRCDGKGRLAHQGHVLNGVCFRCSGKGVVAVMKKVKVTTPIWWVRHAEWNDKGMPKGLYHDSADKALRTAAQWTEMGLEGVEVTQDVRVETKLVFAD